MRFKDLRFTTVALLSAGLMLSGTAAASAAENPVSGVVDVPSAVTIAPGQSGVVPWTVKNTSSNGYGSGGAGDTVVFTAPGNTTFPAQTDVPAQFSSDNGSTWGLSNIVVGGCAVSNAGHTLTCAAAYNGLGWSPDILERFNPTVTVDPAAPAGATLAAGSGVFRYAPAGFAPTDITASLNVNTPATANTGTPAPANPAPASPAPANPAAPAGSSSPVPVSVNSDAGGMESLAYTGAGGVGSLAIWAVIALLAGIVIAFMATRRQRAIAPSK